MSHGLSAIAAFLVLTCNIILELVMKCFWYKSRHFSDTLLDVQCTIDQFAADGVGSSSFNFSDNDNVDDDVQSTPMSEMQTTVRGCSAESEAALTGAAECNMSDAWSSDNITEQMKRSIIVSDVSAEMLSRVIESLSAKKYEGSGIETLTSVTESRKVLATFYDAAGNC